MTADVTSVLDETRATVAEIAAKVTTGKVAPRHAQRRVCRWIARGVVVKGRAVRLEAARVGGRYVSSLEALARFMKACSEPIAPPPVFPDRTPAQRQRDSNNASARLRKMLEKAGCKPLAS